MCRLRPFALVARGMLLRACGAGRGRSKGPWQRDGTLPYVMLGVLRGSQKRENPFQKRRTCACDDYPVHLLLGMVGSVHLSFHAQIQYA
jgi:hypothetical protein